jgi:hypothetical protein
MKRVYYSFLPLDYQRPGGVWWYRDLTDRDANDWINTLKPIAIAIRVSDCFQMHDPMSIEPPADSIDMKGLGS